MNISLLPPTTNITPRYIRLSETLTSSPVQQRQIVSDFNGGHITSDAGLLLLRQVDRKAKLTNALADVFPDIRQAAKVQHGIEELIRQRVYSLACGYEDLNDHDQLRHDAALQTALDQMTSLASRSTPNSAIDTNWEGDLSFQLNATFHYTDLIGLQKLKPDTW